MKIKELKKLLSRLPDDLDVLFVADDASSTLEIRDTREEATCVPGERIVRVYLQDERTEKTLFIHAYNIV